MFHRRIVNVTIKKMFGGTLERISLLRNTALDRMELLHFNVSNIYYSSHRSFLLKKMPPAPTDFLATALICLKVSCNKEHCHVIVDD